MGRLDLDQTSISQLRLSRRVLNILKRNGVARVGELKEILRKNKLASIRSVGTKIVEEVLSAVNEFDQTQSTLCINREESSESIILPSTKTNLDDIDSLSIEILDLHASIKGRLFKNGISTIGDLKFATDKKLLNLNHVGVKRLIEIKQALKSVIDDQDKFIPKMNVEDKQVFKPIKSWAEITQSYFEN